MCIRDRYYVDTVGKNTAAIKKYIQNQLKEDLEYDQMSLVEYIDPFTGEPVSSCGKTTLLKTCNRMIEDEGGSWSGRVTEFETRHQ